MMLLKNYFLIVLFFCSFNSFSSETVNLKNSESIYTLSLTSRSHFDNYVSENMDGTLNYNWDSATACLSPYVDNVAMKKILNNNIDWFKKVKTKPFYNREVYLKNNDFLQSIKQPNSHAYMIMRGPVSYSFFTLGTNKKECDILIFSESELNVLAENEKRGRYDWIKLKDKYRNLKSFSIKSIWEGDIFKPSSNWEMGILKFDQIIDSKSLNKYMMSNANDIENKKNVQKELYKNGVDYFFVKLPSYKVNYEFCGIQYKVNKETPLESAMVHLANKPQNTYIAKNITELFRRIIKDSNACGILQAEPADLDKLKTALKRRDMTVELMDYYVSKEKFNALDKAISKRKIEIKKNKALLNERMTDYECTDGLAYLAEQCVLTDKTKACLAYNAMYDRCAKR
ncbi:hypothetical protein [Thalassotalea piscium]|uniref:Uncharacterized protein n=1 Tax=Thalassotalea piscium TaxID=1230533 RepID=A0A7X0NJ20_9GAMM|nr:hypothetical protein [Thalassotalea piscium]MBB6544191.1 hypothetical protein [Thalassotalea piscium]